jgi:pimeloyl-ACP methyl ester carboxylesterase
MGAENVQEFSAAARSRGELEAMLEPWGDEMSAVTADQIADALGDLVDEVDREALTGDFAAMEAAAVRHALSSGIGGWVDDDLAFVKPWGFDLDSIAVPTAIWQGAHDRMVPFAHGEWLAAHIPGARAHLYDDEGHISLALQLPRILAALS